MIDFSSPLVTVVIPTTHRHDLVQRALASVFAQTHRNLEVIVIVDGPNPETVAVLGRITDPRLRMMVNEVSKGAGHARNIAGAVAKGSWIAFLDDDDEWIPEKLQRQLAAVSPTETKVLLSCRTLVKTPKGSFVWPRMLYDAATPVDEYLFDRRSFFRGGTHVGTSSYLMPAALFRQTQFGTTRQNEDTMLLLRVTKQAGGRIMMVDQTMVVQYKEEQRDSLGADFRWHEMLDWLNDAGDLITPRAYSGFALVYLGSQAARHGDRGAIWPLVRCSFRRGRPTVFQLLSFLTYWTVPIGARQRVRALLSPGKHRTQDQAKKRVGAAA